MKQINLRRLLLLTACACVATLLDAQIAPVPALQGPPSPVLVTDQADAPVTPDQHPLSGGQTLGIGSWGIRHSYLTPSLRLSETLDSNPLLLKSNDGSYRGFSDLGASVQWTQYMGRDTEIHYAGAMRFDSRARLQGYDQFTNSHSAAISRNIRLGKVNLLIDDEAQYSQSSSFGGAGMEGMGLTATQTSLSSLQSSSTGLRSDLLPNQSILTGRVGRIANTTMFEVDAHLDTRDTVTLEASYGLLHFNSNLLTDTNQASVVGGYNRAITALDSIALEGAFTRFTYQDNSTALSTEYVSALYSRRLSGRLSIEVGGGPQITQSRVSKVDEQHLGWQARGTLRYQLNHLNLSAQGMRSITGGAGVLNGALTNSGQGGVEFSISRAWSMSFNSGVSRNQQLNSAQRYDLQFVGFVLNHKMGRYASVFMSYDFQHQATASVCTGPACGYAGLRNVFGLGFAWNYRPIGIE